MSMTINIPSSHSSVGLLADIVTALHNAGLETDSITTMSAHDLHIEVYSFPKTPEHQLQLVWDMESTLGGTA